MIRTLAALMLVTSLALGGCAQLSAISQGISLATKTIANPVTKADEAKIELAMDTALQLLLTYRRAGSGGKGRKKKRPQIRSLQP